MPRYRIVWRRVSLKGRKKEYLQYREMARALARERAGHFARAYGFSFRKIFIRNQKSRWGSCSKSGNLNFHYKIALMPSRIADYIIVHELCHLAEFNHSKKFWELVARTIPDHKRIRKELRNSRAL